MKTITNERGIALVTALLLTLISLAIVMTVLYFIMQHISMSAAHKRYKTALEASHGGVELFTKEIIPVVFSTATTGGLAGTFSSIGLQVPVNNACFQQKLSLSKGKWTECNVDSKSLDPKAKPDMTFILRASEQTPNFKVYTKLVDTTPGNSDLSGFELLDSGAGVVGSSSGVSPKHIPALYRVEVQGERETNPQEKAQLSVLYAY